MRWYIQNTHTLHKQLKKAIRLPQIIDLPWLVPFWIRLNTHTQTTTTTTKQEQYIQYVLRKFISKNPPAAQCVQCFTPLPNRPHMSPSWPGLRASDLLHLRLIFLAVNILELVVTGGGSKGINKSLEHHFKLFFCPLLFFKEVKFQYKGLSSRNVGYSGNLPSVKHRETFPTSKR